MNIPGLEFEDGLPSASLFDPETRNLVVTDELMAETDALSHSKLIPQEQGESYHQSERAVHGAIQESSRHLTDSVISA